MAKQKRQRRSIDQKIADLAAKIVALKEREARKQAKADPALRHVATAVKSIDKALAEAKDAATKKVLADARSSLNACLGVDGAVLVPTRARRSPAEIEDLSDALLAYVRNNPGQRGEEIAAALGTDTKAMRPVMQTLIADGKVTTEGERRGMRYVLV